MSRALIVCLPAVIGLSALLPHPASRQRHSELLTRIDSLVSARVAADSFSGVVVIAGNGNTIYERASGIANRETRAPMTIDTKLQIASTTKLFTQIAIRQLEQQGRLALTDTLGKFLPQYHNARARSKVTVDQLLTHRSGIGSFWNAKFMASRDRVRSVSDYVDLFQDDALLFEPGTSEAYSNGGYVLLGAIIEQVSGQSYHDYLRDHVFRPAGMRNTVPYDSRVAGTSAAVGYTTQPLGPMPGDSRLAGSGPRPGYQAPSRPDTQLVLRHPGDSAHSVRQGVGGMRLRIMGADGKELSAEEARAAVAQRQSEPHARRPNTGFQPSMSGPAGDHYSTAGDFVKLAHALLNHVLLDSARTAEVLGTRYAAGGDFRASGGGPGVNAELSIFPNGEVVVALSNYDPPAATVIAEYIREGIAADGRAAVTASPPHGSRRAPSE